MSCSACPPTRTSADAARGMTGCKSFHYLLTNPRQFDYPLADAVWSLASPVSQGPLHMPIRVSQDFLEKVVILLLTALLTGLLAPYVLKRIDEAKSVEQKILDADLARQAKVIEAQSKFLDDLTETLWNWRYLSMKVA